MDFKAMQDVIKSLRKDATTTGISTATGLNFYYLEQQAKSIYPVFYPLLASIPRVSPMYNGQVVGGTGVNWKAITGIGAGDYPAVSEGNRNAFMKFTEKDYFAAFKFLGEDTEVSFQGQQTGMGFEDNIGLAQVSMLNLLLNNEEKMLLYGNSGSGGNGFQLGTAPTPTLTAVSPAAGTSPLADATYYVSCIALTGWGIQLAGPTGVQAPFTRNNADGSQDTINGGTSAISLSSAGQATTSQQVKASVTAIAGAMGYAWYIGTTNALSTQKFAAVSPAPTYTFLVVPPGGNQAANATGLNTDNSANALDFDGLTTWAFNYSSASSPSYWKDLGGASLTSNGDGTIAEFETVLDFLWTNYKLTVDKIWLGGTLIDAVSKKIIGAGTSNLATRLMFESSQAGQIVGGTFTVAYRSKYGPGQAKQIDVVTHPWLPQGVIFFDLVNNPYPAAGNSIPSVRRVVTLEDHFSIKWPYRKLQHEVGVYAFETLQVYIPFGLAVLTSVGAS